MQFGSIYTLTHTPSLAISIPDINKRAVLYELQIPLVGEANYWVVTIIKNLGYPLKHTVCSPGIFHKPSLKCLGTRQVVIKKLKAPALEKC